MPETRKLNLRLPPDLYGDLVSLAERECSSANAVMVAALRNWVEFRSRRLAARAGLQATTLSAPARVGAQVAKAETVPKVGANQPCPCGSGAKYKRCHGRA